MQTTQQGKFIMKPIKLLAAVIVLSLATVPFALAQETETPTEKATPSPTEKSEAKKSDEEKSETEKPTPEKSATPAEKSAAKSEKTEGSPSPKGAAAATTKTAAKGSVESQLKDIENKWAAAFQSRDTKEVEPVLADDYVLTNEKGKVLNRGGALKQIRKDTDTYEKSENSNMVVHMVNRDAAVVTGMTHDVGKDKGGKPFNRTFRWTDTFVTRNGKWQAVATQVTLVSQK
jgi:ketosteroid isomerase-like protein